MEIKVLPGGWTYVEYPSLCNHDNKNKETIDYVNNIAKEIVKIWNPRCDITLIGRGTSGCMLSAMVTYVLISTYEINAEKVNVAILRKPTDDDHHACPGDFKLKGQLFFIDDFICSGETLFKVIEHIKNYDRMIRAVFLSSPVKHLKHVLESDYVHNKWGNVHETHVKYVYGISNYDSDYVRYDSPVMHIQN